MDGLPADLKAELANVRNELQQAHIDALMRSLKEAAEIYNTNRAAGAMAGLDAVMAFVRDERLEAPFRFLVEILDKSQRKGRTKPLDVALSDARLAATVDAIMEKEGMSLEHACIRAARKAGGDMIGKQLMDLRENIRRGNARPEAIEVYKHYLRRDSSPSDEPPAPLAGTKRGTRKSVPKP